MGCCAIVPHASKGLVERWGRFHSYAHPGCTCLCPLMDTLPGTVSLRVQQLNVTTETKTKDSVFVKLEVSVQFQVMEDRVRDAYYKLTDPRAQCRSYVNDAVRATVPRITLDDVFTTKDEIASAVRQQLEHKMQEFGLRIIATLVVDIVPSANVKKSMNEINANARLREAATDKAEANKIAIVKKAEADAESKYLAGVGVANQRKAIVGGLRDSILHFSDVVQGIDPKDVMDLVLITQYFDTLKDLGHGRQGNTMFIPHSPASVGDIAKAIRAGFSQPTQHDPSDPLFQAHTRARTIRKEKLSTLAQPPVPHLLGTSTPHSTIPSAIPPVPDLVLTSHHHSDDDEDND